jgi:integrase
LREDLGLVFPNRAGKPTNADNLYHRGFKPLLEKAELSGFAFHSLRDTCATLLLSRNVNSRIVSEMLGHATTRRQWTPTLMSCRGWATSPPPP